MDTPFEEVLEKAKAGDPKAQTEVRTSVRGELGLRPGQASAEHAIWAWVQPACTCHAWAPMCGVSMFVVCCFSSHHSLGSMYVFTSVQLTPELGHHLL